MHTQMCKLYKVLFFIGRHYLFNYSFFPILPAINLLCFSIPACF